MSNPGLSSREQYIENQIGATFRQWTAKAALFGVLLIMAIGLLDYWAAPETMKRALISRSGIAAFLLFGYFLIKRDRLARFIPALTVLWVVIITLFLEFAVLRQTQSEVRYVIGNIVIAVVVTGFIPARFRYVVGMAFSMFALFLLPIWIGEVALSHISLALASSYLLLILFIMLLMRFFNERSLVHEFGLRYDLDRHRDGLEAVIASRTRDLARNVETLQHEIAERKKAEAESQILQEQLLQSQKVEAIGRLAGGVAHDFNNLTAVVLGYGDLLLQQLRPEDPRHQFARQIVQAALRSAALTRQLLAFSRRQTLQPEVLDLNTLLRDIEKMLGRLIGEDVKLVFSLAADLGRVKADPGQIEQVVTNLVFNARDAMPLGGTLTFETANVEFDALATFGRECAAPGSYVRLTLTDTGSGMDKSTLDRIFEPFFTTKEKGKGTGLGLATAFGIVKQSGGCISASSEPGVGSTFTILLPRTAEENVVKEVEPGALESVGGCERILLVEDEVPLRELCETVLSHLGYRVSAAGNGPAALLLVEQEGFEPDLVITDVIMPGMSGAELAARLRRDRPGLRVLFMSGYTDEMLAPHGVLAPGTPFIQKPFKTQVLVTKVREVLGDQAIGDLGATTTW